MSSNFKAVTSTVAMGPGAALRDIDPPAPETLTDAPHEGFKGVVELLLNHPTAHLPDKGKPVHEYVK